MSLKGWLTIAPELGEQACVLRVLKPARAPIMALLARRRVHLGLIAKLIERSPVVAAGLLPCATARRRASLDLPAGYEAVDVFILDWLAAEALRHRRNFLPL
jgi:hypothetical protein